MGYFSHCFSHHCDRRAGRRNLRKEKLILARDLRESRSFWKYKHGGESLLASEEHQETEKGQKVGLGYQHQGPQHSDPLPLSMAYLLQVPQPLPENKMFRHMSRWRTFHSQMVTVTHSCECVHTGTHNCMDQKCLLNQEIKPQPTGTSSLLLIPHKTRCTP